MLTILINAVSAKSGGAATYVVNLAQQLGQIGSPHRYIFYVPPTVAKAIEETNSRIAVVETTVGSAPSWRRFLWDQVALRRIVKRERIDVLISSSDFGIAFPPCRQVLFIRNSLFFSPFYLQSIVSRQTWRSQLNLLLRRRLVLLSARSSDVVMIASQSLLKDLQRFARLSPKKVVVNPFGVPLERFVRHGSTSSQTPREGAHRPFRLLHVSEYCDYKNLTTLLKAVRTLSDQGVTDFTLVTTADPWQYPEDELVTREADQALATHPQVAAFVKFTGPVPYDDIPALYADSDLFVFPSVTESFGHPLVEAMASGLPILASDIPICREICEDVAVYFDPLDPKDLAEKVLMLRDSSNLRGRLGESGRKRAETHFDWKDHVQRLVEILERVAADA